jgi:hypothetical protein
MVANSATAPAHRAATSRLFASSSGSRFQIFNRKLQLLESTLNCRESATSIFLIANFRFRRGSGTPASGFRTVPEAESPSSPLRVPPALSEVEGRENHDRGTCFALPASTLSLSPAASRNAAALKAAALRLIPQTSRSLVGRNAASLGMTGALSRVSRRAWQVAPYGSMVAAAKEKNAGGTPALQSGAVAMASCVQINGKGYSRRISALAEGETMRTSFLPSR